MKDIMLFILIGLIRAKWVLIYNYVIIERNYCYDNRLVISFCFPVTHPDNETDAFYVFMCICLPGPSTKDATGDGIDLCVYM